MRKTGNNPLVLPKISQLESNLHTITFFEKISSYLKLSSREMRIFCTKVLAVTMEEEINIFKAKLIRCTSIKACRYKKRRTRG